MTDDRWQGQTADGEGRGAVGSWQWADSVGATGRRRTAWGGE